MTKLNELLGKDLAGYKLVVGKFMELDHQLMGYFPAIFSKSRSEAIFVDEAVYQAAEARLEKRPFKTHNFAYLLEPEGKGGFVVEGSGILKRTRTEVYTKEDLDTHVPIEWAPGLL